MQYFSQDFPLLRSFHLRGLYGYKDIGITCEETAAIVLAENGVGKTTLLNTLYALLSGRTSRLATLEFHEAILQIGDDELVFTKEHAFKMADTKTLGRMLKRGPGSDLIGYGVNLEELHELLMTFVKRGPERIRLHPTFRRLFRASPYDDDDLVGILDRLKSSIFDPGFSTEFGRRVSSAMGNVEVLYLPTYRRIEADFEDVSPGRPSTNRRDFLGTGDDNREHDQLIFFGLRDVEEQLATMTRVIQKSMFEAYSTLSGNVIDTLLSSDQFELDVDEHFDMQAVQLMLERLGKTSISPDQLERALQGANASFSNHRPLAFFLRQLLRSYDSSRPQELAIEQFVAVVNGYLREASTEKEFRFDKVKLKVEVWHTGLDRELKFGSLSSGEKQVISVFAKLILDSSKQYLILIDEPELSLSIEWQRRFLPDILETKSCRQLVAITHSPFVFENQLDRLARSMSISLSDR